MEPLRNDMDDLFRKSGELYPLSINGSDWEGVQAKIGEETLRDTPVIPNLTAKKKDNKRRWGLLLLIPIGLGAFIYFSSIKKQFKSVPVSISKDKQAVDQTAASKSILDHITESDIPESDKNTAANKSDAGMSATEKNAASTSGEKQVKKVPDDINKKSANLTGKNIRQGSGPNSVTLTPALSGSMGFSANDPYNMHDPVAKSISLSVAYSAKNISVQAAVFTLKSPGDLMLKDGLVETGPKPKSDKSNSSKGFYIGVQAGPDLTTVKFQTVKQLGYSFGILIGYRFNARLAVESGFLWDKKYYYSSGEYFNTSKLPVQPPPVINSMNGYCNMFEIPIDLRYDFPSRKNHGFFAEAGFSSYIMKKEDYSFLIQNTTYPIGPYPYYNTGKYFLSVLQLSGGYEYAIGTKTKIQIEPYIKIPLQGMGIGSLPISSAGIYFGIIHSFK